MYQPSEEILKRYADVLVKFAANHGKGIKAGDTVCLQLFESAKPLLKYLIQSVVEAGGLPFIDYTPGGVYKTLFDLGSEEQYTYSPRNMMLWKIADMDHLIYIRSEQDKHEYDGVDSSKLMADHVAYKYVFEAREKKENQWKFSWCLALYGTESMANEAGMSLEEYWEQIIKACFLDVDDPIQKWQEVAAEVKSTQDKLNALPIEWLHIVGEDTDLKVQIGTDRKRLIGDGANIPSFEIFISPDRRGTEGRIRFSEPLYQYWILIKWIEFHFENGIITKATAQENEKALLDMLAAENANKIGEFSLTDRRISRITKFMGDTLFDENVWWPYGNTHIAVGNAYKDSYRGDIAQQSKEDWKNLGFNDSAVHTDIVSTTNRTVTATLTDGTEKVIYKDGEFVI